VPSYEKHPMMLINPYGVDIGTSGLIIQAQSREEIYADKLIPLVLCPSRIKYCDLWDILWLHEQGIKPRIELIADKLKDRNLSKEHFLSLFNERSEVLANDKSIFRGFIQEMRRFLPVERITQIEKEDNLWGFITFLIEDLGKQIRKVL
jgi:hypothetical protein